MRCGARYCTCVVIWWEKCLEIAERSWVFPPEMMAPSGSVFIKATVADMVGAHACNGV
jgi:hypothetical protein